MERQSLRLNESLPPSSQYEPRISLKENTA